MLLYKQNRRTKRRFLLLIPIAEDGEKRQFLSKFRLLRLNLECSNVEKREEVEQETRHLEGEKRDIHHKLHCVHNVPQFFHRTANDDI